MSSTLTFWTNVPKVKVRLWSEAFNPDNHSSDGAWDERYADVAGNTSFMMVPEGPATAYLTAPGYQDYTYDTIMPDHGAKVVILNKVPTTLAPLTHIARHRFVDANGKSVFLTGCTDFLLYRRYLDGEDITPLLAERQALGCNMVRVFGMCHWIPVNEFGKPAFKPQDYGERFYTSLKPFVALCASYGLYVYWSTFPDNGIIMPNLGEKQAHHKRVISELKGTSALYELTNEVDAHDFNYVDASQFERPTSLLSCAGSQGEGDHPYYWDFFDFHPRRDYPAHIKDCNLADNPNFLKGHDGILGEPDRYGWQGNLNALQAFESAGSSRGTSLGIVFHSRRGVRSELFDSETRNCAEAFISALKE